MLQVIPACVLIQVCLVHTDPQGSKEREKTFVAYVLARTGIAFICMENPFFWWETKRSGPSDGDMSETLEYPQRYSSFLVVTELLLLLLCCLMKYTVVSVRNEMEQSFPLPGRFSKSCQMVQTHPVSFCLLEISTVPLAENSNQFSTQIESAP